MTRFRRLLSDLALIPRIWRRLLDEERAQLGAETDLRRYQAARAEDPEGVAEMRRLCTEPSGDLQATQARRRVIRDRWCSAAEVAQ